MIQTGMLAAAVFTIGLIGPASAGSPSLYLTRADATEGLRHGQARFLPLGETREAVLDDVMRPPQGEIDPGMTVVPPDNSGRMPVILPPGGPGGNPGIEPR